VSRPRASKRSGRPARVRFESGPAQPRAPDGRAELRHLSAEFGRRSAELEHAVATDNGCPECRGVLYVSERGQHGWLSFQCRVGHAYSADSLLEAKEEQLEESLWATVEVLDELVQLYGVFALREQANRNSPHGSVLARRLALARRHVAILRGLIESEGPAPAPAGRRSSTHARK
jgi:two-component system chemotaxis response regulator CheB